MREDRGSECDAINSEFSHADDNRSCIRRQRLAQDVQGRELAARMGVSPARICVLERDERRGAVTLKMMQRAADALGCEFVYALLPKQRNAADSQSGQAPAKPRIQLASDQLTGDSERQRRKVRQEYARRLTRPER